MSLTISHPRRQARTNYFPDIADLLERFVAYCANEHPLLALLHRSPQADDLLPLQGYQLNPYACPTPLPLLKRLLLRIPVLKTSGISKEISRNSSFDSLLR